MFTIYDSPTLCFLCRWSWGWAAGVLYIPVSATELLHLLSPYSHWHLRIWHTDAKAFEKCVGYSWIFGELKEDAHFPDVCLYLIPGVYLLMLCSVRSVTPGQELSVRLWSAAQVWSKVSSTASVTCYSKNRSTTAKHTTKLIKKRFNDAKEFNPKPTAFRPVRFRERRLLRRDVITVRLSLFTFGTCPIFRCLRPGHI